MAGFQDEKWENPKSKICPYFVIKIFGHELDDMRSKLGRELDERKNFGHNLDFDW